MKNYRMSRIRSKNSTLEITLRRALWRKGIRYRIHYPIIGKPDVAFPSKKLAIFVDSDFWHGKDWKKLRTKLKNDFWYTKIQKNIKRDKEVTKQLKANNWVVVRFWENEINDQLDNCINKIKQLISI